MPTVSPILVLVPGFPADESDSSCLPAVQNFVEALGRRLPGSVDVIAFQYPFVRRSYAWKGVHVHGLGGENIRLAKPKTWLGAIRTGRRVIAGRNSGVIHSFWLGECALVGALLARRFDWKHVVSIGGQEARRRTMYSAILQHADFALTAGSIPAASAAQRCLKRRVDAVIPLGIDLERLNSLAQKNLAIERRTVDILSVGSLIPVKRTEIVIAVASRLKERHPRLRVDIVGDGPERTRLQRLIGEAGVTDHVRLRGHMAREDVLGLMQRSKILLHPSEYESQGYVLLEALASGMYVVCREVGYHPESLNVEHAADVDGMAAAVGRRLERVHHPEPVQVPTASEAVESFLSIYMS